MFQLLIAFVSRIYAFFQQSMPTNILIRATHTRRGLKWACLRCSLPSSTSSSPRHSRSGWPVARRGG